MLSNQSIKFRLLEQWFRSPQGIRVAQAFAAELLPLRESIGGQTLLQLGNCGDNLWLASLRFQYKWIVTPYNTTQKNTVVASLNALPIDRDSVDCVVAPLTLEAFADARYPLDEIDRVLKSMGYAIFFGVNPVSFWGAALKLRIVSCYGYAKVALMSSFSLKRAMAQRGFQQCVHNSFYYIPPVRSEAMIQRLSFLNEMGKMIWPFPAGFYCLILQKYHDSPIWLKKAVSAKQFLLDEKASLPVTG
ncbi:class I SAM-dependent methyltransferase [Legionella londiniensis]|uniref:Methyl-transferase n=1 Tax=Legionella londiniensis TaxID=45068 RepID=A0A0W0VNN4_9GAMM|nr:methyltransferase domain-containing protein [Legionella londiniensis]KTD21729.1 methyl-transferase [Legionella londiniensis]STX93434.1 methyl-transferase [Legionella londiniensis]